MKKYKTLLISLIICFICTLSIGLTACTGATGETGAQGEQGIQGEKGDTGAAGEDGDNGLSAYELYCAANPDYTGTLADWLLTLYGEDGNDGLSAYELYCEENPDYTGTLSDWLLTLYGEDGNDGKSAYQLYCDANPEYDGDLEQWLEDLVNGKLSTLEYTVTFNSEGGSEVESQSVKKGDKVTEPEAPTLAGHTFLGWYVGEEKWSFIGYTVTENITLTAKWSVTNTDITYTLNTETETYEVTAYSGTDEAIDVRATIDGTAVTAIADNVFKSNTHIKSVTLPEGITSIGTSAFNSCSSLESITLPASLTTIGSTAFADSANLANVYYAGTATQWASITFGSGSSSPMFNGAALYLNGDTETPVTALTFESTLTAINSSAFYGCTSLTSVTIPASVTSIGGYAFKECVNLEKVEFATDSQLTEIGTEAFYGCTLLESYNIPEGVTTIGTYAFYNCTSLTSIVIPDGVETIGEYTFYNNTSLASAVIGDGVTTIGNRAFASCSSLMSVTVGKSVESIGTSAFNACYSIIEVYNYSALEISANNSGNGYVAWYTNMPVYTSESTASGEFITEGDYIFYAYTSDGTTIYYLVRYTGSETKLTLPTLTIDNQSVGYSIKRHAFAYSDMTSVVIPEGVTEIGNYAFYSCKMLTTIYYNATAATGTSAGYYFANAGTSGDGITLYIGANVTSLPRYLFHSGSDGTEGKITTVIFDKDSQMKTITTAAFYGMDYLTTIVLPASIETIASGAFNYSPAITTVYYYGTADDKENISITATNNTYLTGATWYYYSEEQPTDTENNYWHLVEGVPTAWTTETASGGDGSETGGTE